MGDLLRSDMRFFEGLLTCLNGKVNPSLAKKLIDLPD
jgi:hypothetical protein